MSVAGIASAGLSQLASLQRNYQQVRGEFKQLGQDLQAGNLTQAQTDFVTLSQSAASQLSGNSPVAKALNSLGQALQSGNLSAAQQAFAFLAIAHGRTLRRASFCPCRSRVGTAKFVLASFESDGTGFTGRKPDGGAAGILCHAAELATDGIERRDSGRQSCRSAIGDLRP